MDSYLRYHGNKIADLTNKATEKYDRGMRAELDRFIEKRQEESMRLWKKTMADKARGQRDNLDSRTKKAINRQLRVIELEFPEIFEAIKQKKWQEEVRKNAEQQRSILDSRVRSIIGEATEQLEEYIKNTRTEKDWDVFWKNAADRIRRGESVYGPDGKLSLIHI